MCRENVMVLGGYYTKYWDTFDLYKPRWLNPVAHRIRIAELDSTLKWMQKVKALVLDEISEEMWKIKKRLG